MTIVVERPGLQTLIEGGPRRGYRHLGVPWSGAADRLSLALANRLAGNAPDTPALEITLSGLALSFTTACRIAVTGARCRVLVDDRPMPMHSRLDVAGGSRLELGAAETGVRSYLAVAGGIAGDETMGSQSTYLPAGLGGMEGRALKAGDTLDVAGIAVDDGAAETPAAFRFEAADAWTLRACRGAEYERIPDAVLFGTRFRISGRNDRMGTELTGAILDVASAGELDSRPVFPGTVQCPESGVPFILGADAQTTGGYTRIAEVIRADRHLIGQLRTGASLRFLERDSATAAAELRDVHDYWRPWLPRIEAVI